MEFKKVALDVQRRLIDADINVGRMEHVNPDHLQKGVKRIDIYLDMFVPKKQPHKAIARIAKVLDEHYGTSHDNGGFWHIEAESALIALGIDIDDEGQAYVGVEEQSAEFINDMMGEQKLSSFKEFVIEARKPGVSFTEERTKGVVTKVIAELEAHEAGRLTKLAREYHKIVKLLDKLEKAKAERNAQLKELIGTTFDPETDKYCTRVMKSATFAATLAKETHPDDIAEKVEVQYERLVDGLMALLTDELKPAGDELLAACTRKWKPEPKSPNLTVKKIDESLGETVRQLWRKLIDKVKHHLARFDKGIAKLEKALPEYVAARDAHVVAGAHKSTKREPAVKQAVKEGRTFKQFVKESSQGRLFSDASLDDLASELKKLNLPGAEIEIDGDMLRFSHNGAGPFGIRLDNDSHQFVAYAQGYKTDVGPWTESAAADDLKAAAEAFGSITQDDIDEHDPHADRYDGDEDDND